MRKTFTTTIAFLLLLSLLPITAFAVPASSWALDEVTVFIENGLLPQRLSGRDFRHPVNRESFCILIMHAYPLMTQTPVFIQGYSQAPFTDTNEHDITWAYQRGIVSGTGQGRFTPNRIITRGEIARMFHNLLITLGIVTAEHISDVHVLHRFDDADDIPWWAVESVALLVEMDVMQGTGSNFLPKQTATFEQAMLMINRLFRQIGTPGSIHMQPPQPDQPVYRTQTDFPDYFLNPPDEQVAENHVNESNLEQLHVRTVQLSGEISEPLFVPSEHVNQSLGLTWNQMPGAMDYKVTVIMRRISVSPVPLPEPIPEIHTTGGALHFTLPELRPIKNYSITVTGLDANGWRIDDYSIELTTAPAPQAVTREQIFFNGEGTTPAEKQAAAATITVRVWQLNENTGEKTSGTMSFPIHHALADVVIAIFDEIYNGPERFPIRDIHTIRPGSTGEHGRGTAIDINANENWYNCFRTGNVVGSFWRPFENPFSITPYGDVVTAFERHGFTWGGDSWRNVVDFMHFSYFGT